jgi:small-conductance mechanosensitive channel
MPAATSLARSCLLVVSLLLPLAPPAGAQEAAPAEAPAKAKPETISVNELPQRADADEQFASDVLAQSRKAVKTTELKNQLEQLEQGIGKLSGRFKDTDLTQVPIMRLDSLERHWRFYDEQLADWRKELQRLTEPYTRVGAEIVKRRTAWTNTRERGIASGVTPAMINRIDQVIAQLNSAEDALSKPLGELLQLGRRAGRMEAATQAGRKGAAAAIEYQDSRLLVRDASPLWIALNEPAADDELQHALAGLEIEKDFINEYREAHKERRQWYLVGAVVLLPLLVWLSRRSRRLVSDDPALQGSANVLLRPISAWLVLTLLGAVLITPGGPVLPQQAYLLLALIPVLRLLPKEVFDTLGPWPYIGTALYVLDRVGFIYTGHPFYHRIHLLVVTVLGVASLAWLLIRAHRRDGGQSLTRTERAVRTTGAFAIAALLLSLFANLVGNVSLATMLTNATLESGYLGLALYAGASVLAVIAKLLFSRRESTRFNIVRQHTGPLLDSFGRLIKTAALLAWIVVTLNEFRVFRPIKDWLTGVLTHPIEVGEISITLGNIVLFVVSIYVAFWLARTIRAVLAEEVLPNMSLPRGVGNSISTLSYYSLILLGLLAALAVAGFEVGQFAIVFGALGVGIGFGLQNVVNNFVSGLILMFERPIQPGDIVEITGTSGKVREIGMRATTLTTFEGADVVVPNGTLLSDKLINWTLSDMNRRLDVNVGVAYGTDPRRVLELLLEVARTTEGVASQPDPVAVFVGFGASSLDFSLRAWTDNFAEWVKIRSELTVRVSEAIVAAGIEIPFPQQDLHLRSVSVEAGTRLGRGGADTDA